MKRGGLLAEFLRECANNLAIFDRGCKHSFRGLRLGYSSGLPLSSGIRNTVAMISRRKTDASRAIAARNEYLAARAPTTSGPGDPTARPRLNKTFCAVARAAVGYASDRSAPTPAMWFTEIPMIAPTQRSSVGPVCRRDYDTHLRLHQPASPCLG